MASLIYFCGSTNRFPQAAAVSPSSKTICAASSRLLTLTYLDGARDIAVSEFMPGHEAHVTCVEFINQDVLASTDEKGVLRVWRRTKSQWKNTVTVQAHTHAVSALHVYGDLILTGSSDSSVKVWEYKRGPDENDELTEKQSIDLQGKYPLSIALTILPRTQVQILAVAGTDTKVHIWTSSEGNFVKSAALAGHEDWIRSLAFNVAKSNEDCLVLASGSQDSTIRLWNILPLDKADVAADSESRPELGDELLDSFEASLGDLGEAEEGGRQISMKRHILTVKPNLQTSQQFSVTFDALLIGHEAGVTSISWRRYQGETPILLSTSTDSSLIMWSPSSTSEGDASSSIWINRQRFGDVGGQRLGGFVGGLWAQSGQEVLAWGWSGGSRRWHSSTTSTGETWDEVGALTGHCAPVKGLDWSPDGAYLISAGLDQTTRIHAPVADNSETSWHEIARPQVHGYDLLDAVFINRLKFASIADEKVVRIFEAPRRFVEIAEQLGISQFNEEDRARPLGANVPPLGLSNKATVEATQQVNLGPEIHRRPYEGELQGVTLWPETEKIFGHGYESISLAISHSKTLLATACKASSPKHAVVRVYDISEGYKSFGDPLAGHDLTITRIAFSPNDKYILTVSRDRSWRLFEVHEKGYVAVAADKSHGRIIWDCSWAIEGDIFATASRDKTVKVWQSKDNKWTAIATIKLPQPATAVAFAPLRGQRRHIAVGLENGEILIYSSTSGNLSEWELRDTIDSSLAHVDHIHRLAWRPVADNAAPTELASCSEDGTLRILKVHAILD